MIRRPAKPPRSTPFPSEAKLQAAAIKRIRTEWAGEVLNTHGSAMQRSGEPDLLICLAGVFVAIELKQPGRGKDSQPTPLQAKRLRDYAKAGAVVGCAHDLVELDELLEIAAERATAAAGGVEALAAAV